MRFAEQIPYLDIVCQRSCPSVSTATLHIRRTVSFLIALLISIYVTAPSHALVLVKDTVWQGEVSLTEDVVVRKGVTLSILPGTVVRVSAAESTKTDPEYLSPLTEITVRGRLKVEGSEQRPVILVGADGRAGSWAGIIVDHGAAEIAWCRISQAETGVTSLNGTVALLSTSITGNRYGVVASGDRAAIRLDLTVVANNDYGVFSLQSSGVSIHDSRIAGNRKRDSFTAPLKPFEGIAKPAAVTASPVGRRYGNEVFRGDTIWQGRIEVAGTIRVPEGSRLIIAPGTIVEFVRRDTDGDGIGENGILVQGSIIAKGTKEQPVVFRSAERDKAAGDWDAINIMNSASAQNLLEFCRIEHAYRALHFHFSTVAVQNSVISDNFRAIQFQESLVDLRRNSIIGNKSGVQGRDSDITLEDNLIADNYTGANFFRTNLTARNNRFVGNWREGVRVREGITTVRSNLFDGNRFGLMLADMFYGEYAGNVVSGNLETGISVKNSDNLELAGNAILLNGLTGLSIQDSRFLVSRNLIVDNGERGIGVQSFDGVIRENNLAANGRYAIDLDGSRDVSAPSNWWGNDDREAVILDKHDNPARGRCSAEAPLPAPVRFVWPLSVMTTDARWRGTISVKAPLEVVKTAALTIAPGTTVEFDGGTGIAVKGKLLARGTARAKILFTAADRKGPGDWDEILLEYAAGSMVDHCVFEYASWGLHSHFTELTVANSVFRSNHGGMRFRSGPVRFDGNLFENNSIGIRSYIGTAVISGNTIRGNEVGIFVRERGGGLSIAGNNIFENSSYNIRIGDFNTEDVDARGNWWGNGDPLAGIFDARSEPGIGTVIVDPILSGPVDGNARVGR